MIPPDPHVAPRDAPSGARPDFLPPGLRANAARAGLASLLSRLSGVLREVVLAAIFGATTGKLALPMFPMLRKASMIP